MPKPDVLVSVLIPAFNGSSTIEKTLASIVKQEYRPLQLIVIDDSSRDDTPRLVESMHVEATISDLSLVRHEKNQGLARSLNDGLSRARGELVLILHQDCELVNEDWISKASMLMSDGSIAVVTGYYGISDDIDESFVKRAFGVLRRQYHSRPSALLEDVTFSEGKCDLYRRYLLSKVSNFPESFRIAGEDLVVSYSLRKMGYRIVKSYELPVIQRFTGKAESIQGNIEKEFLFGKAMGGVFARFRLYLFAGAKRSTYSGKRSLHRASQPLFIMILLASAILALLFDGIFPYLTIGLMLSRVIYYSEIVLGALRASGKSIPRVLPEVIATSLIGIISDIAYTSGFVFGLARYVLGLEL